MKRKKIIICGMLTLTLIACTNSSSLGDWTESELQEQGIIDLSELGKMTYGVSGEAYINSRKVPDSILGKYGYTLTKTYVNLLQLDSEAIKSLPYEVAAKLINASPNDIRQFARRYEIDIETLREAAAGKGFTKQSLYRALSKSPKINLLRGDLLNDLSDVRTTQFLKSLSESKGDKK
jgi:hypothetical protein